MINHEITVLLNERFDGVTDPDFSPFTLSAALTSWRDTLFGDTDRATRYALAGGVLHLARLVPECSAQLDSLFGTRRAVRSGTADKSGALRVYARLLATDAGILTSDVPADIRKLWTSGYGASEKISAACFMLITAFDRCRRGIE